MIVAGGPSAIRTVAAAAPIHAPPASCTSAAPELRVPSAVASSGRSACQR